MCPEDFHRLRKDTPAESYDGDVYFIQGGDGGLIKIGWALDVRARMMILQCGSPVILQIVHSELGSVKREKALHRLFAHHRRHGEWFEPAPGILSYIEWSKENPSEGPAGPPLTDAQWARMHKALSF